MPIGGEAAIGWVWSDSQTTASELSETASLLDGTKTSTDVNGGEVGGEPTGSTGAAGVGAANGCVGNGEDATSTASVETRVGSVISDAVETVWLGTGAKPLVVGS
jgi:hypothetical protein